MTLTRAIDILDKREQCIERYRETRCNFQDNDACAECRLYVSGRHYDEAVRVVHKFAKGIKRRCETK